MHNITTKKSIKIIVTIMLLMLLLSSVKTISSISITNDLGDDQSPKSILIQVIYTTNLNGSYERVFKYDTDFYVVTVLRNTGDTPITIPCNEIIFSIIDEYNVTIYEYIDEENYTLFPDEYMTLRYKWSCPFKLAVWKEAGFMFVGKKFSAQITIGSNSKWHGFYIDEFGIPRWLRNSVFVVPPRGHYSIATGQLTIQKLKEYYRTIAQKARGLGVDCFHLGRLYDYGYHESHQPSTINYWFPASDSSYAGYCDPNEFYVSLTDGNVAEARELICDIVSILHEEGIHTRVYSDPVGMYSPNPVYWTPLNPFYIQEFLSKGYVCVGHHHASDSGWARFNRDGSVKRLDFFETKLKLSDINHLGVATCHCGPSKLGILSYSNTSIPGFDAFDPDFDYGFYPRDIMSDLQISSEYDPSWHYEQVKQTLWLSSQYGIDGVCPDDTGRLIMGLGAAEYADDLWHNLVRPVKPSDPSNLYGISYCSVYDGPLREVLQADVDMFTLNAYADMIKHMRWQTKYVDPDGFLMSSDYFVPSDVDWDSIVASEDVSTSDQFDIWKPSFARWAYNTFQLGYRHLRTDLRRTLMPGLGSQSMMGLSERPDLTTAIMLVTGWANKVDVELNDPGDCQIFNLGDQYWGNTEKLVFNYLKMKQELPQLFVEEAQELLYHKKLLDPVVKIPGEYEFLGGKTSVFSGSFDEEVEEPYTVLYMTPCEFGEKNRVLHVMNSRVVSHIFDNNFVPADYCFKVRVPEGEEVQSIYLVSPDFYNGRVDPDRDGFEDDSFAVDVTDRKGDISEDGCFWDVDGDYVVIKVPYVVAYSAVVIEFAPLKPVQHVSKVLDTGRTRGILVRDKCLSVVWKGIFDKEGIEKFK